MPHTEVHFYREVSGEVPVLDWLKEIERKDQKALDKLQAAIELLREKGHELHRPHSDQLRNGIHELRVRSGRVNYRILYFFHGQNVAILAHGLTKDKQDLSVGEQIYEARQAANLTQQQLAERVNTTQSVISSLEDAEYEGHSMPMLRRIAAALGRSVHVRFD